jgi:hypothetical protein
VSPFQQAKIALVQLLGLPKDALHIYVGLATFLGAAALLRRPLGSWVPIAAVIAAALIGEVWDLIETQAAGARAHFDRNWHDVWNTCFWPSVLFVLARYTRLLSRRAEGRPDIIETLLPAPRHRAAKRRTQKPSRRPGFFARRFVE